MMNTENTQPGGTTAMHGYTAIQAQAVVKSAGLTPLAYRRITDDAGDGRYVVCARASDELVVTVLADGATGTMTDRRPILGDTSARGTLAAAIDRHVYDVRWTDQ